MIGGEWPRKGFEDVPPTRYLNDKVPVMTNIGARRSKSLEKEKEHSIHEVCRVIGLLAPKSGFPGLSQLSHTEGLNLGRFLLSFD